MTPIVNFIHGVREILYRMAAEYLDKPWVPVESRRVFEAEFRGRVDDIASFQGIHPDAAEAVASYALLSLTIDGVSFADLP